MKVLMSTLAQLELVRSEVVLCTCRSSHLTNDAVQEKFEHYGTFEDSNKLSMEAFQELFAGQVHQRECSTTFLDSMHYCDA